MIFASVSAFKASSLAARSSLSKELPASETLALRLVRACVCFPELLTFIIFPFLDNASMQANYVDTVLFTAF